MVAVEMTTIVVAVVVAMEVLGGKEEINIIFLADLDVVLQMLHLFLLWED